MMARGVAAVLVGSSLLIGCGSQTGGTKAGGVHDSTSATQAPSGGDPSTDNGAGLVLRWRMTGGIAGLGGAFTVPEFSLYPDGTAIVPGDRAKGRLKRYHLKPQAARALFDEATAAGLAQPRKIGPHGQIADAMTLVMWLGKARTEIVQPEAQSVPATRLWNKLHPEQWKQSDQQSPPDTYVPERYAVSALGTGEHASSSTPAWPLAPLTKGKQVGGGLCTVYSGGDAARVRGLAEKAPVGQFTSGGQVYSVRYRPLLPDEKSCDDLA
ncbi:hypothetical protein [Actinomadura rupiterrae]|uniref:hypothetical protein n=1 Tax=Actinomadura rupiterrae TaxID=559627 RepID=UPI0020A3AD54|nr:hypothetical protein [Actinomadura rupiterrae]MCP2340089.1 hypothetical protein [Actinomadura rupiterrae]